VTWLLDVSVLVGRLVQTHEHQRRVAAWWPDRSLAICPITELGFLRVACALGFTMNDARTTLEGFLQAESPIFIPCDRRALDSATVVSARKTTDIYLADLAASRGWRLITLDSGIQHPSADLVPEIVSAQPPA
jgi:hypothetical protein